MRKLIIVCVILVAVVLFFGGNRSHDSEQEAVGSLDIKDVHYSLDGDRGVVLCFHGTGGSARGWSRAGDDNFEFLEDMAVAGWAYVCPTSLDRDDKQWSAVNTPENPDIVQVDKLLEVLGVSKNTPLILVGHSNGGGMVSRYAIGSTRAEDIVAVQISNSGGMPKVASMDAYTFPTLFNYSECDEIINENGPIETYNTLTSRGVPSVLNKLDGVYETRNYKSCHEFVNTGTKVLELIN